MCLAQGPQRSDAGEARPRGPSVSSQALYKNHLWEACPWAVYKIIVESINRYFSLICSTDVLQNSIGSGQG